MQVSIIIGLKYNNGVVLAADKQVTYGNIKYLKVNIQIQQWV